MKEKVNPFNQLLLVLAGGLIGVLGNQFFFERNKKLEADLELKKEFLREEIPLYKRIINFTYYFQTGGIHIVKSTKKIATFYDPFGVIYNKDSASISDTTTYIYPSFVEDTLWRHDLLNDIEILKKNKDKIDGVVWEKVVRLINFLNDHPPPVNITKAEILKSDWADSSVFQIWKALNVDLYNSANEKLNNRQH